MPFSYRLAPMSYATRIPCLDGLRGLAALVVMLFHFNIFFLPQARLPLIGHAYLAVDFFFILSGFVMAHVYGRRLALNWRVGALRFARARFARLYPLFAVTTLAMAIVLALSGTPLASVSFSGRSLALQPFLLQQWASGLSWDYPSWSISTEAEAYVFFVFCGGLLLAGRHPRLIAGGCIVILAALSMRHHGSLNCFVGVSALLRTFADFSLGVLLYRAHSLNLDSPRWWVTIFSVMFAALATITRLDILMVASFGCLIYYSASDTDHVGRLLNSRPLVALGNWSYSIYLWHAPAHFAVMAVFAGIGYPVTQLGLASSRYMLLTTAIAVVALSGFHYVYFEVPCRRFLLGGQLFSPASTSDRYKVRANRSFWGLSRPGWVVVFWGLSVGVATTGWLIGLAWATIWLVDRAFS
jgi:peptidoglycan/LPS O-acetylase OafA/YrhL